MPVLMPYPPVTQYPVTLRRLVLSALLTAGATLAIAAATAVLAVGLLVWLPFGLADRLDAALRPV